MAFDAVQKRRRSFTGGKGDAPGDGLDGEVDLLEESAMLAIRRLSSQRPGRDAELVGEVTGRATARKAGADRHIFDCQRPVQIGGDPVEHGVERQWPYPSD
jgi:hypothetical protein